MIDFFATAPQYADHLVPIWHALEPGLRGSFFTPGRVAEHVAQRGIDRDRIVMKRPQGEASPPIVVASFADMRIAKARPVALVEHGAGQTYGDGHASNPGGREREPVALFICPNERVAQLNRDAYPETPAVVVGCPKLDRWIPKPTNIFRNISSPTVAISFHWDNTQCPESRWAFPHYELGLADFVADAAGLGWEVIGHGHPRFERFFSRIWARLGVEHVTDFGEVIERADVYVVDNSSTLFEFAALDRPVVALNTPLYRRDVHHGLRFWDDIPGLQCDHPDDLLGTVSRALLDPLDVAQNRRRVVQRTYDALDGRASARAAAAIERHLCGGANGGAG